MAVRKETKTRWITSGESECNTRELALKTDVEELASEVRKEVTPSNARELREALNAYLGEYTHRDNLGGLMINVEELRRVLKHAPGTTGLMYDQALAVLRGLTWCTLTNIESKLRGWYFGDDEKTRHWRSWVMNHAVFVATELTTNLEKLPTNRALKLVRWERARQEELKHSGKFTHTCADAGLHPGQRLAILTEEVGEVARELCDANPNSLESHHRLKTELVQVAAAAVAWIEFLERIT